ncbi:FAD dependent oxidoreductase [Lichtheimia hyalospora FSU 10163]|nr:FAD dependent oxidoreductase [Lichtheimia hyalospora FSU 10163]
MSKIVILGAGVSGLTSAVSLLQTGYKDVTVIGQYIPGDMTTEYTSPWAGASVLSFASAMDKRLIEIDTDTHKVFKYLANNVPESSVQHCPGIQIYDTDDEPGEDNTWVRQLYSNFQAIPKSNLPAGAKSGYTFDSYTLSVPKYLKWLVGQITTLGGRVLRDHRVGSLQEVVDRYQCDIVINCTGLGAGQLNDVRDSNMHTIRGQTVLVDAPHIKKQYYRDAGDVMAYIIPRGDGSVICGGTYDKANKDLNPDPVITKGILERCYDLCPDVAYNKGVEGYKIISHNVGFRPGRHGGIRLERETRVDAVRGKKYTVVHNYGHSSHGYQSSWGSAERVVKLVKMDSLMAKL